MNRIDRFSADAVRAVLREMGFTWNKKLQTYLFCDEKDDTVHVYVDECETVFVFPKDTNIKETLLEAKRDAKDIIKRRQLGSGIDVYDIYFECLMNACDYYYCVDAEGAYEAIQKTVEDDGHTTIARDITTYFDAGTGMAKKDLDDLAFVKEAIGKAIRDGPNNGR